MDNQRLVMILTMELTTDKLKLADSLEFTLNSDMEASKKLIEVKRLLTEISLVELSMKKFEEIIKLETKQNEENGKI